MKIYTNICIYTVQVLMMCMLAVIGGCAIQSGKSSDFMMHETVVVDSEVEKLFHEAVKLLQADQYDAAIDLLNDVVHREKGLTAPYINLAMAYWRKGDEKQAEENLLKALAIDKAQPVANNELGLIYRKQGRFEEAKSMYANALSEYPDYLPAIKNLGILCDLYMRDAQCAIEQFEKYQEQVPDDETIRIWIADIKLR